MPAISIQLTEIEELALGCLLYTDIVTLNMRTATRLVARARYVSMQCPCWFRARYLYMLAASLAGMWQVHCSRPTRYLTLTQVSLLISRAASRRPAAVRI